jgi:hypothetical protein
MHRAEEQLESVTLGLHTLVAILANSARLLRQQSRVPSESSGSPALTRVDTGRSAAERRLTRAWLRLHEAADRAGG